MAVAAELEITPVKDKVTIYSDLGWVVKALIDWLPVWKTQGMNINDGKSVAHASKLMRVWQLAHGKQECVKLVNVKAYKGTEEAHCNNQTAIKAKQKAKKEKKMWQEPYRTVVDVFKETQSSSIGLVSL